MGALCTTCGALQSLVLCEEIETWKTECVQCLVNKLIMGANVNGNQKIIRRKYIKNK